MSGKENGVSSLILKETPLAIYAHNLNLAIQSSINIPELTLVIAQMGKIINFFNSSPNRTWLLSAVIEIDETQPIKRKKVLINFSVISPTFFFTCLTPPFKIAGSSPAVDII